MDTDENESINERLRSPPVQQSSQVSATALVRRHFDAVMTARKKDRDGGKTWAMIGADLRPSDPIPGGTVGKAFKRIAAERSNIAGSGPGETITAAVPGEPTAKIAASDATDSRPSRPTNPFTRTVDPVRNLFGEA